MIWTPRKKIITSRHKQRGNLVLTILPGQDPFYGQVVLLMSCEETSAGATIITPTKGPTFSAVTAGGGIAQISSAFAKFGNQSLESNDATGAVAAYWEATTDPANLAGMTAFTIEFHYLLTENNFTLRPVMGIGDPGDAAWSINISGALNDFRSTFTMSTTGSNTVLGAQKLWSEGLYNTWYHFAVSSDGTNLRHFVNGVQKGATDSVSGLTMFSPVTPTLYLHETRSNPSAGGPSERQFLDNIRITNGAARYTANFTPPDAPYPDF